METFNIVAGIASILGLLFSGLSFWQARRASIAARQARDSVVLKTLSDELESLCTRGDQLLDYLTTDRVNEAGLRANELASTLSEMPYRRSPYLTESHKNALLNARALVQSIGSVLARNRGGALSVDDKQGSIAAAQRILVTLRKIVGTIKGRVEHGDEND